MEKLLEMKEAQIRTPSSCAAVTVKRMIDTFNRSVGNFVGVQTYTGPFTFNDFERHLFKELGKVKASSVHPLPDLKESPIPRISRLKKRILSNNSCVSGKLEDCDSMASGCSHTRSAHGSHSMPRETGLRSDRLILPRIEKSQSQSSTAVSSAESNLLEVRHGNTSQFIRILDGILLS